MGGVSVHDGPDVGTVAQNLKMEAPLRRWPQVIGCEPGGVEVHGHDVVGGELDVSVVVVGVAVNSSAAVGLEQPTIPIKTNKQTAQES